MREYRGLGINRASFGAQTFGTGAEASGRSHTARDVRQTIRDLRRPDSITSAVDPSSRVLFRRRRSTAWSRNLDEALALRPEHLSFYLLEVHEGTPLADQIRRGRQPLPDDDLAAAMYRSMLERASAAGYEHYEISNLCLPGYESRHNSKYWLAAPVYGFGCSAHSYDGRRTRWANERDAARYTELIETEGTAIVETTELDEHEASAEAVFLGLRLMRGISLNEHRTRFGEDIREKHALDLARLKDAGLIELNDNLMKLTRSGALLSNEVFAIFV